MTINIGDRVAYSAAFLRSTGQQVGDAPFARGIVRELLPLGSITLAGIEWESGDWPERVAVANLAKVGPNLRFCAG